MPIYEYQCRECSHRLEKLQKMSDAPLTRCPECGKETLTKLVSAAGFRLAGGGWYETDFKKDGKRNLAGDSGASKSSESGSADSKGGGKGQRQERIAQVFRRVVRQLGKSGKSSSGSATSSAA